MRKYLQETKWWIISCVTIILVVSIIGNFTLPTALFSIAVILIEIYLFDMKCYRTASMLDIRYARLHRRLEKLHKNEVIPTEYLRDYRKLEEYRRNNMIACKKYEDLYIIERQAIRKILKEKRKMPTTK